MKRRTLIWILVIVLAVGGFFGYRYYRQRQAALNVSYKTETLTRGSLTALVGATGTVRANQTAVLNWQTTGSVSKVNVAVGDQVKTGQVLAELDISSLPQNIISARADLVTAKRNLADLKDSETARAKAQQTLATARKSVEDAQKKVDSKSYTKASQDVIDTAYANYILAQQEVENKQQVFDGMSHLAEDDPNRAAALSALAAAKQKRDISLANYNEAKSKPDQIDINIAQANLDLAKANLADAQREYDRLKNGVDPNDLAAAEARVEAIQATLDSALIKAPFSGTITDTNSKLGDQVTPTIQAFRIDDLSRLLVDVQITEVDINRIQPGQPAQLTFDAIPDKEYQGKVSEVGQVGTTVQGVVNFTVTIELTNPDAEVRPGMTSAVNIVVAQLDQVLLVPNRAVRLREGQRVVYVLRNGTVSPVDIQIGSTSDVNSEILSGDVKEGDQVVLNPPASLTSGGNPMFGGPRGGGGGGGGGGGADGGGSSGNP